MTINILDLPDELLIEIFRYIQNIRNKVALLRVCKQFNQLCKEALKTQKYHIVGKLNYVYRSESIRSRWKRKPHFLPLNKLLTLAPRLTHFIDDRELITTFPQENIKTFDLSFIDSMELLLTTESETRWIKDVSDYPIKLKMFLDNCPNIQRLKITMDTLSNNSSEEYGWSDKYRVPFLGKLKSLEIGVRPISFGVFLPGNLFNNFFGIIDGQAPNLEKLSLFLHRGEDLLCNTTMLVEKLITSSPKLRYLELYYEEGICYKPEWNQDANMIDSDVKFFHSKEYKTHDNLQFVNIQGIMLTELFWSWLLPKCPNLKFLIYEKKLDKNVMTKIVNKFCPQVIHDQGNSMRVIKEFQKNFKEANNFCF